MSIHHVSNIGSVSVLDKESGILSVLGVVRSVTVFVPGKCGNAHIPVHDPFHLAVFVFIGSWTVTVRINNHVYAGGVTAVFLLQRTQDYFLSTLLPLAFYITHYPNGLRFGIRRQPRTTRSSSNGETTTYQ